jgi:AP-3 complex subunit delta
MFEKTLTDVVKGIRASRRDTSLYISQCIAEIKAEINSSDMFVKANALQKLTFLQMMGYGMSWASFASIELMSSTRYAHKRIAYLAASQGFTQDTDVILLTTNLLKKELRGGVYEAGLAVNCISNIVTEDLARDLLPELTGLTSHPQPYLRKKAILCLFKVFVKYPQGLRLTFAKIQQCLDDPNPSVVSCAVNVITELSDKNPKNYLPLAPAFFKLLTTSSNNWMLIKVVKLLGSLVPEEPRLARKLLEPLSDIVRNTKAKSLLYEAVHTITLCLPYCKRADGTMPANIPDIVTLCADTLQSFVNEADQNLKYLGLVGFASLMQSHPHVLSAPAYRPIILACLSDQDVTIRTRALSLLTGMASRRNLMELVTQLLRHVELATGSYKLDLVSKIVDMCSTDKYSLLTDFSWYLDVLFQLGHVRGLDVHADLLSSQISDVALRVLPVRRVAVERSIEILLEREGVPSSDILGDNGRGRHIMPEILPSVAWIVGEYSGLIRACLPLAEAEGRLPEKYKNQTYHAIVQSLTSASNFANDQIAPLTEATNIQQALKVFAAAIADQQTPIAELEATYTTLRQNLPLYLRSTNVEVQERAFTSHALLLSLGLTGIGGSKSSTSASTTSLESDLLGMDSSGPKSIPGEPPLLLGRDATGSSRLRQAAAVLNYTAKPSPMKPTSARAQKKKSQSPIGVNVESVDMSVFTMLVEGGLSRSMPMEVSFTKYSALRPERQTESRVEPMQGLERRIPGNGDLPGFGAATASARQNSSSGPMRDNFNDPFYLRAQETSPGESQDVGQFGMIELSGDDATPIVSSKKKKKKDKTSRNRVDYTMGGAGVAVYDSDDDDSYGRATSAMAPSARKPGKGFEDLARVDLTEPLRHDEVMPERKHRIVPDHVVNVNLIADGRRKKEKKATKEKKKRKDKALETRVGGGSVGDLLELGGFGSTIQPSPSAMQPPVAPLDQPGNFLPPPLGNNAVSDAFEDLLGLHTATVSSQELMQRAPQPAFVQHQVLMNLDPAMAGEKRKKEKKVKKEKKTKKEKNIEWPS